MTLIYLGKLITLIIFQNNFISFSWVQPVFTLMQLRHMDIVDCNNHVKSASEFFGPSCAVDSLSDIYNPLGDNSDHLCELCASKVLGQRCTAHDPYAGYQVQRKKSFLLFLNDDVKTV